MTYALGAIGTLAVIALGYFGMLKGWQHRQQRQTDLGELPAVPDVSAEGIEGVYIATTTAGDWMDRIAVHELGVRSVADLAVTDTGLLFRRRGAADVFIPKDRLADVRTDRGIAGKVTGEASALVVVTWQHDGRDLDTGFRPRRKADTATLTSSISTLIGADR